MSAQHLEVLETTVHKAHQWIDAFAAKTHTDPHTAYLSLRAVLQTLRDRLPVAEAAQLGAQLPLLIRGIYYEGWRPSEVPISLSVEQFLHRVGEKIISQRILDPLVVTRNALQILEQFLGTGELRKVACVLPDDLCALFPDKSPEEAWKTTSALSSR